MEGEEALEAKQALEDMAAASPTDSPGHEEAKPLSMGLEKTKAENELKLLRQRASDLKNFITKEFDLVSERIRKGSQADASESAGQVLSASAEESISDLSKHKSAAHAQLGALVDDVIEPQLITVHSLTTKAAVDDVLKQMRDGGRDLRKNKVKDFMDLLSKTKRYLTKQEAKARRGPAEPAEVAAQPVCNPLWTVIHEFVNLQPAEGLNVCQSIYEAKAGIRAACLRHPPGEEDIAEKLNGNAYLQKLTKDLLKHVEQTGSLSAVIHFKDAAKYKRLDKLLRKALDGHARTVCMLPQQPWASKVFMPEMFHTTDHDVNVFTTNNGMCEGRIYLSGSEAIVGIHYDDIAGDSFRAKRHTIAGMTIDQLGEQIKEKKGFAMRCSAEAERLVIIPSGRIVVNASSGATYLRWGIYCDDSDLGRVHMMLQKVLEAFPEYRNVSFPALPFLEFLESRQLG